MKIKIGIVGYGNLGKAVEQNLLLNPRFNLVAVFSRRLVRSKFNTPVEPYTNIASFIGKIDVMLLCGGSKSDLEIQTPDILNFFDCINTFDTHKKIPSELENLDILAKESNHRLVMSTGWDPGIFSNIRALSYAVSGKLPYTFWGKGVSMGHSDAIRKLHKVKDALEFTIPNEDAIRLAKSNHLSSNTPLHFRDCYVVCDKLDRKSVEQNIKSIPNYFKGQPTKVNFISQEELFKLKEKLYHKGQVISSFKTADGSKCNMDFRVSMSSNPSFTANIMIAYISAILTLKDKRICGAFTPLDIPMSYLFYGKSREYIVKAFC